MAVVKIVNVVSVLHRRVPTSWTVLMGMIGVFRFSGSRHGCASLTSACPLRPQLPPPAMRSAGYLRYASFSGAVCCVRLSKIDTETARGQEITAANPPPILRVGRN